MGYFPALTADQLFVSIQQRVQFSAGAVCKQIADLPSKLENSQFSSFWSYKYQRPAIPGIGIEVLVSRPVLVLVLVLQFRFSRYWYWYWYWPFAISKYWYWYWYWPFCQPIPIPNLWHKKGQKTQFAWVKAKKYCIVWAYFFKFDRMDINLNILFSKILEKYWYWYWGIGVRASIGIGIDHELGSSIGIGIGIGLRPKSSIGIGIGIGLSHILVLVLVLVQKLVLPVSVMYPGINVYPGSMSSSTLSCTLE